tara:strand:+ start:160 stop:1218 length:1059 start_codon:yes stop_codon:yes gene_type:complete
VSGDPRFYGEAKSLSLSTLSEICGGRVVHGSESLCASGISTLANADDGHLVYVSDEKLLGELDGKNGYICLLNSSLESIFSSSLSEAGGVISVDNPRLAFARCAGAMYPETVAPSIHPTAQIASSASIGINAAIGAYCVVGDGVELGDDVCLDTGVILEKGVSIGNRTKIGAHTVIRYGFIENDVHISDLCSIGTEGFGIEGSGPLAVRIPHFGRVLIRQGCQIGAECTIDRGVMSDTVLGAFVMLDNQVHIAHNVEIGENTIIAAQVGIAGSAKIGKNCLFGGQVGVSDHVTIGDDITVAGQSGVTKDLDKPQLYIGYPAQPARDFWRVQAGLRKKAKKTGHNRPSSSEQK